MTKGLKTIIYPAPDLARAKALFSTLFGAQPYLDEAYYVAFNADGQDIGLDPHGHPGGPVAYWHVVDINASLTALLDAGAVTHQDVKDVGGGALTAIVKDPNGNLIGLHRAA